MITVSSATQFETEVLKSQVPVLVDFYAPWCGPCRSQAPILDSLAADCPNIKVLKVNTDETPDIAATYGIMSIPTLLVFENGELKNRAVGLQSIENLKKLLGL